MTTHLLRGIECQADRLTCIRIVDSPGERGGSAGAIFAQHHGRCTDVIHDISPIISPTAGSSYPQNRFPRWEFDAPAVFSFHYCSLPSTTYWYAVRQPIALVLATETVAELLYLAGS